MRVIDRPEFRDHVIINYCCCANCNKIPEGNKEIGRGICDYPEKRFPSKVCLGYVFDFMSYEERLIE